MIDVEGDHLRGGEAGAEAESDDAAGGGASDQIASGRGPVS